MPVKCLGKGRPSKVNSLSGCCGKPADYGVNGQSKTAMKFSTFNDATDAVRQMIRSGEGDFNQLALALFALQKEHVPAYRDLCQTKPVTATHWREIPTVPTTAFRDLEITSLSPETRTTVFHSSGTTGAAHSRHWHNALSLAVYETSLRIGIEKYLRPKDCQILTLTPPPNEAPHSSLSHMAATVHPSVIFGGCITDTGWSINHENTQRTCKKAIQTQTPLLIIGPAFSFVHWLDQLDSPIALPTGSRVMETGGYKGRSRELSKTELHELISNNLGVTHNHIVCEYGMCELSSQAYDRIVGEQTARTFTFPAWARSRVISSETGSEVDDGNTGLLQVFDLANIRSVLAIQTGDIAVRRGEGFELIGRATQSDPRGCSLALAES